jgi:hypothetical protein
MAKVVDPRGGSFRRKFILGALFVVLVPALGIVLYIMAVLNLSYSDGERSGIMQKFSRKGWICKTYEGELAMSYTPGLAPTLWEFSVRDPALATKINEALGKRVVVHYTEHRGVPTDCWGETNYYIDSVRVVE